MIRRYGPYNLADIDAMEPAAWDFGDAGCARVQLPSFAAYELEMQRMGFLFGDRTLKASISMANCTMDLNKWIRLPVVESLEYKTDILRISLDAFEYDRRFNFLPDCSKDTAEFVLKEWISELGSVLIAMFKEQPIGFLALAQTSKDALFVRLAAVEKKFRLTGAAMALYARACQITQEKGYKKLDGRISSQNTAVMNIYATFGATFSEPKDIFLKKFHHELR